MYFHKLKTRVFIASYISIFAIVHSIVSFHTLTLRTRFSLSLQNFDLKKHRVKTISAENFIQIRFRGFGKYYQEESSCLILPTCLLKNINKLKVKFKSIYQNLAETTFDTNNNCMPTLVSWLVRVRDVIFFLSLSVSLSTSFVPTRSAYLDYNLLNLYVAMCDNDNVVTDEVKLINK